MVETYQGTLIDLNIGDKSSYISSTSAHLRSHEDNDARAATTARWHGTRPEHLGLHRAGADRIEPGTACAGAHGGHAHRTYGVLGDEVNMAACLMMAAQPGQILASLAVQRRIVDGFVWHELRPFASKASDPVTIFELTGVRKRRSTCRLRTRPHP
ncbi:MAG: hypothetical protein H6644_11210 [Caldilineaceae bacterium]|nr:hypothetical protein [Caldilineaceae bacterium]